MLSFHSVLIKEAAILDCRLDLTLTFQPKIPTSFLILLAGREIRTYQNQLQRKMKHNIIHLFCLFYFLNLCSVLVTFPVSNRYEKKYIIHLFYICLYFTYVSVLFQFLYIPHENCQFHFSVARRVSSQYLVHFLLCKDGYVLLQTVCTRH